MPKRAHGRPAKARSRPRRPAPRPGPVANGTATLEPGIVAETVAAPPVSSPGAGTARAPAATGMPRRAPASATRKAPALVVNYGYLRRDIRTLGVLAPSMVVVLVVAYIFLH